MSAQLGTFDELLAMVATDLQPIMLRLNEILSQHHQDATITTRLGDRATTFGFGPQKMKQGYCYLMGHKNWINLGFYQGAHLPDPHRLLEGTGKSLRHIKIRTVGMCDHPGIADLIVAAQNERRQALGLPSSNQ